MKTEYRIYCGGFESLQHFDNRDSAVEEAAFLTMVSGREWFVREVLVKA